MPPPPTAINHHKPYKCGTENRYSVPYWQGELVSNEPSGRSFIYLHGRKGNEPVPYTDDFKVKAF